MSQYAIVLNFLLAVSAIVILAAQMTIEVSNSIKQPECDKSTRKFFIWLKFINTMWEEVNYSYRRSHHSNITHSHLTLVRKKNDEWCKHITRSKLIVRRTYAILWTKCRQKLLLRKEHRVEEKWDRATDTLTVIISLFISYFLWYFIELLV